MPESAPITALLARMSASRLNALFAQAPERAADWVQVTAAEGLPQAQVCYGRMLLEGTGRPKNPVAALAWFRRAAARGDIDAINMVGRCLDNGWGTPQDPPGAVEQFTRAAQAGHAWAQYNVGHMYLDGRGVTRDPALAYAWYLKSAEQQHERAMNLLGRCCEEGWGTRRDPLAAADWYRRSAEAGYFRGQYNWASVLLTQGRADDAAMWFERVTSDSPSNVRPAMREAVRKALARTGTSGALSDLAARLTAAG